MKVKVLSLKQPWAQLIISGKKTIELRKWNTNLRGEFYIHASMNTDVEKCRELGIDPSSLEVGAIIGKAEIVGIKHYNSREELSKDNFRHFAADYSIPCNGFLLENVEKINPIKCRGMLNFWTADI